MIMTVLIIMIGPPRRDHPDQGSSDGSAQCPRRQLEPGVAERPTPASSVRLPCCRPATARCPPPFTGHTADGDYNVTVTYLGRHRYQIDSAARVGSVQGLASERTVRVILGPPKSFKYALFSLSSVDTKNNDIVNGDIWANDEVTVDQNDVVNGSVTSATKYVTMRTARGSQGMCRPAVTTPPATRWRAA